MASVLVLGSPQLPTGPHNLGSLCLHDVSILYLLTDKPFVLSTDERQQPFTNAYFTVLTWQHYLSYGVM